MSEVLTHKLPLKHELARHIADVLISSPSDGQVLTYEAATALWKNKAAPGAGLSYQQVQQATDISTTGPTMVDMGSLSITVSVSGTYLLGFFASCVGYNAVAATGGFFRILKNLTVVKKMRSTINTQVAIASFSPPVSMAEILDLAANDVVKVQWAATEAGSTLRCLAGTASEFESAVFWILKIA